MTTQSGFSYVLRGRIMLLASSTLILTTIISNSAKADLVFSIESVSAQAGSPDNTLEVTLTNNGPSAVTIGGFQFEISAASGVTFTSVDINTNPAYIFLGHSATGGNILNPPPTLPGNVLSAGDNYDIGGSGISLGVGAANAVGLGDVHFSVDPAAAGPIAITFMEFPFTNVSDAGGNDITQTLGASYVNGVVMVASSAVPEPSSLVMTSICLAGGLGYWSSRRRLTTRSRRSVG